MIRYERFRPEHLEGVTLSRAALRECGSLAEVKTAADMSLFTWTLIEDDKVLAFAGMIAASVLSTEGFLWALVTTEGERRPIAFMRYVKSVVNELRNRYKVIHGLVWPECRASVGWVKSAGFKLMENVETENGVFCRFEWRA